MQTLGILVWAFAYALGMGAVIYLLLHLAILASAISMGKLF